MQKLDSPFSPPFAMSAAGQAVGIGLRPVSERLGGHAMSRRKLVVAGVGVLLLAPSAAMANGMVHMIRSFEFTLTGGVIGCVAGVGFALARNARLGRLLAFTIGGGVAAGLIAGALFVGGNSSFFFPNNVGILLPLAIIAVGTGVVGGLAAGLIGAGIRALQRRRAGNHAPASKDTT
jgi:hypothetical protein